MACWIPLVSSPGLDILSEFVHMGTVLKTSVSFVDYLAKGRDFVVMFLSKLYNFMQSFGYLEVA